MSMSEKVLLPHAALPSANWADCYVMVLPYRARTAFDVSQGVLARPPIWVFWLLAIRNRVVGLFGLRPAKSVESATQAVQPSVGMFPIVSQADGQIVLGFDDHHLDFRIVVDVAPGGPGMERIALTTLVERHNLFGYAYIVVITPFHKLVVKALLFRYAKKISR